MDNTKYIVVYNTNYYIPTRQLVIYTEYTTEYEFWEWYYTVFSKLDGDKMKIFDNRREAIKFSNNL